MRYLDELLDNRWRVKRIEILRRDGHKCTVCGSKVKLVIHHTYYKKGKKAWQYPNKSLLTLCDRCHYNFHCTNETPIIGEQKTKARKRKIKIKKERYRAIESKEPRYRKKINGEWVLINPQK